MRTYGFSTGALAKGDFRAALSMLHGHDTAALELSALRVNELPLLAHALLEKSPFTQAVREYRYLSIHAPSKLGTTSERHVIEQLRPLVESGFNVVVHPDAIDDFGGWREFGPRVCIENNDTRKPGRTVAELAPIFEKLPEASWCLDLGHGRQVDGTMLEVWRMLRAFSDRLQQIHLSELNSACEHEALSMASVRAISELASAIPEVPVIIESVVPADRIDVELSMARMCFDVAAGRFDLTDIAV